MTRPLCFAVLLSIGGLLASDAAAQVSLPDAPPPPAFGANERGSLRSVLRPVADIRVSSRAAGIVERFYVTEGSPVKAGDPILSLDMEAERADVAQAEAMVSGAKAEVERTAAEYERVRPLGAENIISEKQLIEARTASALAHSRLAQAEATRDLAKSRLANRTLTSPISGVYLKTSKSVGEAVDRFETVARVVDFSRIEMDVYADAKYFQALKGLKKAKVLVYLTPDRPVATEAPIVHIDPIIDPANGTFRIKLQFEGTAGIAPGYTAILVPPEV